MHRFSHDKNENEMTASTLSHSRHFNDAQLYYIFVAFGGITGTQKYSLASRASRQVKHAAYHD